jgi:hypothetical protein
VAKELADNALDACGNCRVGMLPDGGFYVEDGGAGIGGGPEDVARLFSIRRPLSSSKMLRKPTRGALGNGLRVVAGAVYASGGQLRVITNGRALDLAPQESGETLVANSVCCDRNSGTRVEVRLGDGIPHDPDSLAWAKAAIRAAGKKPIYRGKTSPWLYCSDSFRELLKAAAGGRTVREVMRDFDGGHEPPGKSTLGSIYSRTAASLTHDEAERLLEWARSACEPVTPKRLALLGKHLPGHHAKALGVIDLEPSLGSLAAELPYTAEAWCDRPADGKDRLAILVNRTPVAREVHVQRDHDKAWVTIFGCNLGYSFKVGRKPVSLTINVQAPHVPITSTGKEPDLELFLDDIMAAVEGAARKCQRANRAEARTHDFLPTGKRGRRSAEAQKQYEAGMKRFAGRLNEINSTLDFKVGVRGWCYILENRHLIAKGDFDKAQDLIAECRKKGYLPIDFTAEDENRAADHLEALDDADPARHAGALVDALHRWDRYTPLSFWDNQPNYVQMVVEKNDLKNLFSAACRGYRVPLINSKGWSDLNLRAALMRRFKEHELKGRRPVLLYCGDHDPVGLQIPETLPKLLAELESAVGWSPRNLILERFGLNADFITQHGLTWIDGLQTSSGMDLADPKHKHHKADHVQRYIRTYGNKKVEANALVVRPEAGRRLCREAIEKYLDLGAIAAYEEALAERRQLVQARLPETVQFFLDNLRVR